MAICGIPFKIRRGTKAELDAYGVLVDGEMGLTLDESLVYIGSGGKNVIVGSTISGSSDPSTPRSPGLLFVNTTTSGLFFSTGSGWLPVGTSNLGDLSGNLDDISDGIIYERVKATELDNGYVIQINDGFNIVTASGAREHIDDATIHRSINDSGSSNIDLWSAQRIMEQFGSTVRGISWQEPTKDKDLCEPPISPSNGDRYIVCVAASGSWASYAGYVTEYITSSGWVYNAPSEGWATWVEDEDRLYVYTGVSWSPISSVTYHNYLAGLDGGGEGSYYHLSTSDFNALTTNRTQTVKSIVGPMASGVQTLITVSYNESLGVFDFVVSVPHSSTTGQTTDDHHAMQHSLTSPLVHTVTTVSGYVLKATSSSGVAMAPITLEMLPTISHDNLSGVTPDQHHSRLHSVLDASLDHNWGALTDNTLLGVAASASGVLWITQLDGGLF